MECNHTITKFSTVISLVGWIIPTFHGADSPGDRRDGQGRSIPHLLMVPAQEIRRVSTMAFVEMWRNPMNSMKSREILWHVYGVSDNCGNLWNILRSGYIMMFTGYFMGS